MKAERTLDAGHAMSVSVDGIGDVVILMSRLPGEAQRAHELRRRDDSSKCRGL